MVPSGIFFIQPICDVALNLGRIDAVNSDFIEIGEVQPRDTLITPPGRRPEIGIFEFKPIFQHFAE
jgi:hypothetical protein